MAWVFTSNPRSMKDAVMTGSEREAFYDTEIAPALMALCKKCEEQGMGFLALVDYTGVGSIGETASFPLNPPAVLRYAQGIRKAGDGRGGVNIDAFMLAVAREAREIGHSSSVLAAMGVPLLADA